jgi:hypothetical protein
MGVNIEQSCDMKAKESEVKEPRHMAQRPNIIPYTPHCMFCFLARSLLAAPDPNIAHS